MSKQVKAKVGDEVICVPPVISNGLPLKGKNWGQGYWDKKGTVVAIGGNCSRKGKCELCIGAGRMKIRLEDGSVTVQTCWGKCKGIGTPTIYYTWKLLSTEKERIEREYTKEMKKLFAREFEEELYTSIK